MTNKTRICYVYSDVDYSHLIETIEEFTDKSKYETTTVFIGRKVPALYEIFKSKGRSVRFVQYSGKKQLPLVVKKLRRIFTETEPDIVHANFLNASLTALTAARLCGIKKRVHTRHHSTECHLFYPHAVYYDKFISFLSAKIVAISQTVFDVLTKRENVDPQKVEIIHHGFDLAEFVADKSRVEELKRTYNLNENYPVVGVISRFVEGKGIQFVIPAFARLLGDFPRAKLVLANANGSYGETVLSMLRENLDESQYVLIEFERQIYELYKAFDVFLHVPIDRDFEAFGQIYIEALALEVPSVFTLSGVANEFIVDEVNALIVPHKDSDAIYQAIKTLLENSELRDKLTRNGSADVRKNFDARKMVDKLDELYSSLMN